jgi:hypothetical protein
MYALKSEAGGKEDYGDTVTDITVISAITCCRKCVSLKNDKQEGVCRALMTKFLPFVPGIFKE